MNDTTGTRRYRTKPPIEVDAIQWTGDDNLKQVAQFLADNEYEFESGFETGDWVVRYDDGNYEVFTDAEFRAEFETDRDA